jgi:hypothetical protein
MPPPGKLEVFPFWTVGIVVAVLSGAVAIYASHLHLWGVHSELALAAASPACRFGVMAAYATSRCGLFRWSKTRSHSRSGSRSPVAAISMIASTRSSVSGSSRRHWSSNRSQTLLKAARMSSRSFGIDGSPCERHG